MNPALANLEPQALWKHFDKLTSIPRASTKEAAARDYIRAVATKLGLECVQDAAGNLVVRKPARPGRERAPMALLRATSTWSARRTKAPLITSIPIRSKSSEMASGSRRMARLWAPITESAWPHPWP